MSSIQNAVRSGTGSKGFTATNMRNEGKIMKSETHCIILMTTYNGEKYLTQQIDSIINQTHQNWRLMVRDDGSSDSTVGILRSFEEQDKRIKVYCNTTDKHGAYLNFWTLIHEARQNHSDYNYYFFSDQDDVWEPNKLELMIEEAAKLPQDKPMLLYGDMRVIDQNNRVVYESLNKVMGIGEMSGYSLFFTHGFLWGCDVCVNNALFMSMPLLPLDHPHIEIMSHDNYMGKYALLTGGIKYIDKVMINHRRHGDNTTGGYSMKLSPIKIFKRFALQYEDLAKTHARVYNQTLILIDQLDKCGKKTNELKKIESGLHAGGIKMITIMWRLSVKRKQKARTLGIYIIALMKRYKKYLVV